MIDVTLPGWAIAVFMGVLLPWLLWLTNKSSKNEQDIAVNTANDKKVSEDFDKLYDLITKSKEEATKQFDKLDRKLDTFIASELSFFKSNFKQP